MTIEVDRLAVLNRMIDEGRISDQEYEELKGEILGLDTVQTESDETVPDDPSTTLSPPPPSDDETQEKKGEPWAPVMRRDVSPVYLVVLVIAAAVLLLASSLGLLSWLLSTIAILALGATLVEGGSWVTMAGAVAIVAILIGGAFGGSNNQSADQSVIQGSTPAAPPPVVAGSLGIYLQDLTDLWNTVTEEPNITRGFVHNTEPGQYDSFIYRFGDWGRLAGAYDPANDALYALLATGQFSDAATAQLYLHLCFALQPYSQECIDSYFEQGLEDGTLADFVNIDHHAEWQIEDQTWQVDIESNVLTIRVLGEDVS